MELFQFQIIWAAAASIVVTGWLVVSFTSPSRTRTIVEWSAATAMYVGLVSLFVYLELGALADDSTVLVVAFGFLCVLFGGGLLISLWNTVAAMGSPRKAGGSATN